MALEAPRTTPELEMLYFTPVYMLRSSLEQLS